MTNVTQQPETIRGLIDKPAIKKRFNDILQGRGEVFLSSVLSLANQDAQLARCEPMTIITAALQAAVLNLQLEPNFGHVYIIPYNKRIKGQNGQKDTWITVATFQVGWKGFVQLAQRSAQYATINTSEVREGDIEEYSPLTGEYKFAKITDFEARRKKPIIGYVAYFKLINGFEKPLFMTVGELKEHAAKYSKTYQKGGGVWDSDFDGMSKKTVLKLLLNKFGPMSVKMQTAISADQAVLDNDLNPNYIDNEEEPQPDEVDNRFYQQLESANFETLEDLDSFEASITNMRDHWQDALDEKREQIQDSINNQLAAEAESNRLLEQASKISKKK